ncbi:MAG: Cellulase (glycosyl hydrolase family 5) [Frankiales bacterium]|nr:Cellulase (glycosyl hydrolase family 5) [Frankiales bacterium]
MQAHSTRSSEVGRRRGLRLAIAASILGGGLASAVAAGPTLAATPAPPAPLPALGMNSHAVRESSATFAQEFQLDRAAGSTWTRIDVNWYHLQPTGPGAFEPSYTKVLDQAVASATANGLKVLLTVLGTPVWARAVNTTTAAPPTNVNDYGTVMGLLAQRYAKYPVAYEVWNEANRPATFAGSTATYAQMTCASYAAIKAQGSSIPVVMGATSGTDVTWLGSVLAAGSANCFDVISTHPYSLGKTAYALPASFQPTSTTASVHNLMVSYKVGNKPVWFTEFGWPATLDSLVPSYSGEVTLTEQADYTERFLRWTAANNPYVKVAMMYTALDIADKAGSYEAYMGMLGTDFTQKPVYDRLVSLYAS